MPASLPTRNLILVQWIIPAGAAEPAPGFGLDAIFRFHDMAQGLISNGGDPGDVFDRENPARCQRWTLAAVRMRSRRGGDPATTLMAATSLVIVERAPTTACAPMVTPGPTKHCTATHAPGPM